MTKEFWKKLGKEIFIDGLGGMASGLFATLIIGTIIVQIGGLIPGAIGTYLFMIGKLASAMTGAGIGIGTAKRLGASPLVQVSAATAGMCGAFASKMLAGTVTVGCCANMIGFAVASYRENKVNGLLAQESGKKECQYWQLMMKNWLWLPSWSSSDSCFRRQRF